MPIGPQYTSCVAPQDYKSYEIGWELAAGITALVVALATGNVIAVAVLIGAGLSGFREVVRWMLHGKLICLPNAEDRCVIGTVANLEEVGQDKLAIEKIDNDYAINLILQPFDIEKYWGIDQIANLAVARTGEQGDFLKVQPGMPLEAGEPKYDGYYSTWVHNRKTGSFHVYQGNAVIDEIKEWVKENEETFGKTWSFGVYRLPVLHCECEGSRIHDVLEALDSYPGARSRFCRANFFTRALCKVVATLASPYIAARVIYAWAAASGGDAGNARLDPASGEIEEGDTLLIRGRWVYDAGHFGYNEIHAVRSIQKLRPKADGMQLSQTEFADLRARWCNLASQVPLIAVLAPPPPAPKPFTPSIQYSPDPILKGATPPKKKKMTAVQERVWFRQRQREFQWYFHPALDGCLPAPGDNTVGPPVAGMA